MIEIEQFKIGLLGASKIAVDSIIKPAAVIPKAQMVGVAARDEARAKEYAAEHGIQQAFKDYSALLNSDDIDMVYSALPVSHHAEWAVRALDAGKHVLAEKPFAMNSDEARRVLAAAKANDKRIIEAFHYSHHPAFHKFLDWVHAGKIGKIKSINAVFSAPIPFDENDIRFRADLGGGAMMDLGCYTIHWTSAILDGAQPTSISAQATLTASKVDEHLTAELSYPNDVAAHIETQIGDAAPLAVHLLVTGEAGEISFFNPLAPQYGMELKMTVGDDVQLYTGQPASTYTYQLADVLDALMLGKPLDNEGDKILQQQETLDKVYAAAGLAHLRESTYPPAV